MSDTSNKPIIIVGAGSAGVACALTAAAYGMPVCLIEKSGRLGGTVTQALIHTLGGFHNDEGHLLNHGISKALIKRLRNMNTAVCPRRIGKAWVLNIDPLQYEQLLLQWIAEFPNITVHYHSEINNITLNNTCITTISYKKNNQQSVLIEAEAVIDTTGGAFVVRQLAPQQVSDSHALAGVILQLRGVTPKALAFPKGIALLRKIRKAAANHELPVECADCWLDSGVYSDEVYIKFNLLAEDYQAQHMQEVGQQLLTYLQQYAPAFSQANIENQGILGIRDSGQINGDYCLTEIDIKQGKHFEDSIAQACWPIEHWHPQQGIQLEYLPPKHRYHIPLRSLKVAHFTNLWAAGKCLSAEPRAQASARVVGSCWAMGEGIAKHLSRKYNLC